MHTTLMVARMNPKDAPMVARLFAESDATDLPRLVGVSHRALFRFHDLYFHVINSETDVIPNLDQARNSPLFTKINDALAEHITPYAEGWRDYNDSKAEQFYSWSANAGRSLIAGSRRA